MKVFLVSCFLTITFFSQGWGRPGTYLVKTADDDAAQFEDENDDESLDEKILEKLNRSDKSTKVQNKHGDYQNFGNSVGSQITHHGNNVNHQNVFNDGGYWRPPPHGWWR